MDQQYSDAGKAVDKLETIIEKWLVFTRRQSESNQIDMENAFQLLEEVVKLISEIRKLRN